jgi:hypothetical protein
MARVEPVPRIAPCFRRLVSPAGVKERRPARPRSEYGTRARVGRGSTITMSKLFSLHHFLVGDIVKKEESYHIILPDAR